MHNHKGFDYNSPQVGTFGDGNNRVKSRQGRGDACYLNGPQVALLLHGTPTAPTAGVVENVLILAGSTNASASLTVYDSNDAADLTNKRNVAVPIAGAGAGIGREAQPIEFAFEEGLVVVVVDSAGNSATAVMVSGLGPSGI